MKNSCLIKKQQGMTMIEIMIALLLGAFLLGGVLQIFASSNQSYRMQENMSRLQENGRFAMDFITRDIRMADYLGCLKNGLNGLTNNLDTASAAYDANIHGYNGSNGLNGTNGVAGANLALDAPDTITLRGAFDLGIDVVTPYMVNTAANIKVSTSDGLAQYDIVLVSDCTSADIFEITTDPTTGAGAEIVVHNGGNVAEGPGNISQLLSKTYGGDASIYKFSTITFFIQNNALFKQVNTDAATELVEGIENMQILYGEDINSDNTPDYYVPADSVVDMNQVISVRINLLAVSADDNLTSQPIAYTYNGVATTPADRRLRRVFSSTIAVRNRLQ
jgi:type IV pilus assembly protein PilW